MLNLSNYSKGQFFILTAFAIASILYIVSGWLIPNSVIDTSAIPKRMDTFIFDNIIEKANKTVFISNSCEDLKYNLGEYKSFVLKTFGKRYEINFEYNIVSCDSNSVRVLLNLTEVTPYSKLKSTNIEIDRNW